MTPPSAALCGYTPATLLSAPKGERLHLSLSAPGGRKLTFVKVRGESMQHVLLKAMTWALLLPAHPTAVCEIDIGHRYRPDVVALDSTGELPLCWGECGAVTTTKLSDLASAFPDTHFAVSKWAHSDLSGYAQQLRSELALPARAAPFELFSFPDDAAYRFVSPEGEIQIERGDVQVVEIAERLDLDSST